MMMMVMAETAGVIRRITEMLQARGQFLNDVCKISGYLNICNPLVTARPKQHINVEYHICLWLPPTLDIIYMIGPQEKPRPANH